MEREMDASHSTENSGSVEVPEARSEAVTVSIGEKRLLENGDGNELTVKTPKKARNVKKVAELTLLLAAMVKMRGGRSPTAAEKEMMAEAREKLSEVCEEFAPKEIFPTDAYGAVIEDLGLDKLREQMLGFRPPKLSIAEKVLFTKQKMGKSEELALRYATHSSHGLQTNLGTAAESRVASHATRMFQSDKASHAPISSGVFHPASPLGHVSAATSTSLPYQLPASEVRKSMVSSGMATSHPGNDSSPSLPRVERPQFRLDQRSNGSSYASQIQANSSGGHAQPAWSQHPLSAPLGKTGAHNKVLPQNPVKLEGTAKVEGFTHMTTTRMASQGAASRPLITQTTSGRQPTMHQHMQRPNVVQASLLNNAHCEIGKIVQKLLQPHLPAHPTWTPPPRDYMNKTLACQVCKLAIIEVENVLVCDACDKGYHLKCLQTHNLKAIPRGEWHCFKCLPLNNGKTLHHKYGRVKKNMNAAKVPSNNSFVLLSPEKKAGILGDKANQQKILANGSFGSQNSPVSSVVNGNSHSASDSNARELQGSDISSSRDVTNGKCHLESSQNEVLSTLGPACVSSAVNLSVERSHEKKRGSELKGESPLKPSETVTKVLDHLQSSSNGQDNDLKVFPGADGLATKQCHDNHLVVENMDNFGSRIFLNGNLDVNVKEEEQVGARLRTVGISDAGVSNHSSSSLDDLNVVDWIGDVAEIGDENTYYSSCCINGIVYKVQDHVLFLSNNKLMPSKIQTMWENKKTRTKWVIVNRCYFPGDLPETVGRPCSPKSNEVYESNHGCTTMAGLIKGPCEVLHTGKFVQESERRSRLGSEENSGLRPLFLCRWFYDELKGSFRDVSS